MNLLMSWFDALLRADQRSLVVAFPIMTLISKILPYNSLWREYHMHDSSGSRQHREGRFPDQDGHSTYESQSSL